MGFASASNFHAWACPAFSRGAAVDQTWVTTYDNRITSYPDEAAVVGAGERYWFCWGAFHANGGTPGEPDGRLGQQVGDAALATCLVQPNADCRATPEARGFVFVYGVDGVCHQLANQALYATGTTPRPPLTVRAARGYVPSVYVYGIYGLQHAAWARRLLACSGGRPVANGPSVRGLSNEVDQMLVRRPDLPDDFEAHARSILAEEPELLMRLLSLRGEVHPNRNGCAPANVRQLDVGGQGRGVHCREVARA